MVAAGPSPVDPYRRRLELRGAGLELHRRHRLDRCPDGDGGLVTGGG